MNTIKKIILVPILIATFTYIFIVLNTGGKINQISELIQPLIFASSVVIGIFFPKFRINIIQCALILLLMMVFTYLFNMIELSNWIGSLGFGLLFITVLSYLPQFIKQGYVEKF